MTREQVERGLSATDCMICGDEFGWWVLKREGKKNKVTGVIRVCSRCMKTKNVTEAKGAIFDPLPSEEETNSEKSINEGVGMGNSSRRVRRPRHPRSGHGSNRGGAVRKKK